MFNPSRDQARQFLVTAWHKRRQALPVTPLETLAADLIEIHPEYHELFAAEDAVSREWTPEMGQTNPFLHLSLHLAVEEQLSIDQPPGIRAAFERLLNHRDSRHDALHVVIDALAETLWQAQRDRQPLNAEGYLERIRRTR